MTNKQVSEKIIDDNVNTIKKTTEQVFIFNDFFTPIFVISSIININRRYGRLTSIG